MRILFLCTAHNSLSQKLFLALSENHSVTVEYALSDEAMIEAAALAKPQLIVCPFLTARVPSDVYENYVTLIVHPGPPGDAGPSALDWLLVGDDGTEPDADRLLRRDLLSAVGRSHWGVTVLQAIGELDAGQVWAFDQFPVDINEAGLTKSKLYRGPVTRAAVSATLAAVARIESAAKVDPSELSGAPRSPPDSPAPDRRFSAEGGGGIRPGLRASESFAELSVTSAEPFRGGDTHVRPLLKAGERDFDPTKHDAATVSRRIRSADSQPGCLSAVFGPKLYLYGGAIEDSVTASPSHGFAPGCITDIRDEAVCIGTCDDRGVWITHVRRLKTKADSSLWPKVPAVSGLVELGVLPPVSPPHLPMVLGRSLPEDWSRSVPGTFQEIWVDMVVGGSGRLAYVYFDFYNGAMSTAQCRRLVRCLGDVLATTEQRPLDAVVLMGGDSYFSNGIHLNVIEAASDPSLESWYNINAINDVVDMVLDKFTARGVPTVAALRGNCAAGGVALAAACDLVLAGEQVVLNPAYRALGLFGSEFHSLSYPGRCGDAAAASALRAMTPLNADGARRLGLVDHVLPGFGSALDAALRSHVESVFASDRPHVEATAAVGRWKRRLDLSAPALARARAEELAQMSMDFWSARSERYHGRRRDFVRKMKPTATPLRFASHRRAEGMLDEEERDSFDSIQWFAEKSARSATEDVPPQTATGMAALSLAETNHVASRHLFGCYYPC
ncbi:hypothetical protein RJ55_02690 [Drechmeria coniospora]|nr:hypothetical protein RJ55_02690 [Drechmeria coniospora]